MIRFWDFKPSGAPPLLSESFAGFANGAALSGYALISSEFEIRILTPIYIDDILCR